MKKLLAVAVLAVAAVGGAAWARGHRAPAQRISDAQVKAVIDARLHEMLVRLNGERAR